MHQRPVPVKTGQLKVLRLAKVAAERAIGPEVKSTSEQEGPRRELIPDLGWPALLGLAEPIMTAAMPIETAAIGPPSWGCARLGSQLSGLS